MATKKSPVKQEPNIIPRSPVVVIMGHIDHGKSTLLDYIRKTNIVDKEAGGITQHISAYEVAHTHNGKSGKITFLDTPGHEAFSKIRARGATVADIAILVVSAEDGVKTQTIEAVKAIREAKLPLVVAINKIDKPNANIERTKQTLAEHDIYVEGYGGDVPWVAISAKTGEGIPELLDMLLLVADISDFKADSNASAEGTIIESNIDSKKGISATLIIKNGTLSRGQCVVAGGAWAPVRIFENFLGESIDTATFSSPVEIIGWSTMPQVGSLFITVDNKKEAELLAQDQIKKPSTQATQKIDTTKIVIPVVIKADAAGSLEGIEHELQKISHEHVTFTIMHSGIGPVSESDIKVALGGTNARVFAFNVKTDSGAASLAERSSIPVETFDIIYKLSERLNTILSEQTPTPTEEIRGSATIVKIFSHQKDTYTIGCRMIDGMIKTGETIRIMREDVEVGMGKVKNLQHMKVDVSLINDGKEFGSQIEARVEVKANDVMVSVKLLNA